MWESMLSPEISILEKMLRPFVVYLFLLVGLRLAGKRELAALNAMDLIVLLTLSNTVQNAIIGPDNSVSGGLIGAATLLVVNYVAVRFLFSHPKIDQLVEGRATALIEHGKLQRGAWRANSSLGPNWKAPPISKASPSWRRSTGRARAQRRHLVRGQRAIGQRSPARGGNAPAG